MRAEDFDEEYYRSHCGYPLKKDVVTDAFYGRIADFVVQVLQPARALDAGCAFGFLVEALRARDVDAKGFDISAFAIAHIAAAIRAHCWQASLTDEISGHYDLIVCQEVVAHMTTVDAERAVANLCRHADTVLFSAAAYEPHPRHLNTQGPDHWTGVFAHHGFRKLQLDASAMTPWAAVYRRDTGWRAFARQLWPTARR